MAQQIEITRPDGQTAPAWHAQPDAAAAAPGIVVVQEWWGVNEQIKRVGRQWTDAGYRVLIPDLFRGEQPLDEAEAEHDMNRLDFGDAATQDVRAAVQYLKTDSDQVGVIGFCMGGVLALLAAMHVPEADAAISWYGIPPDEAGDPAAIDIPVQCHFAEQDTFFPIETAAALQQKLEAGNVTHECYRYDAPHAFGNEDWDYYDEQAAKIAWQRSMRFFAEHLQ
ncbi:MAG TPA: dienelactone hydrolase family protein [Salinisphaeraceae bacterium]|nr:dienelactone hydrolase family protein [Salinisphaeraceae bacterium]